MKKSLNLFLTAAIAVLMIACSGDDNSPEKTAEKYLKFLAEGNYDEASKLGTEDTKNMLNLIKTFSGGQKPDKSNEIKNVKCEIDKDGINAECTYCCNDQGSEDKISLVKIDGNWLVDMKKENSMTDLETDLDAEESIEGEVETETESATTE